MNRSEDGENCAWEDMLWLGKTKGRGGRREDVV